MVFLWLKKVFQSVNVTSKRRNKSGGYFTRPHLYLGWHDGGNGRIYSCMVNICRIIKIVALAAFFVFGGAFANNPTPDEDPFNDLFDYGYAYTPKKENSSIVTAGAGGEYNGMSTQSASQAFCGETFQSQKDNAPPDTEYTQNSCSTEPYAGWSNRKWLKHKSTSIRCPSTGSSCLEPVEHNSAVWVVFEIKEVQTCPPENEAYRHYEYKALVGEAPFCFDPYDLNDRDSCPDSINDGAYVLPIGDNTSDQICHVMDDGSRCLYDKVDGHYLANFENTCYQSGWPEYDETGAVAPDPSMQEQCIQMGTVFACLEDPANVCTADSCMTGCGTMAISGSEPQFVCLSGDTDADGTPDYTDTDIDGDGIPNTEDPDADGDGVDDPTDPDSGAGDGSDTPVNVDMSGVESRLNTANSHLSSLNSKASSINNSIQDLTGVARDIEDELSNSAGVSLSNMSPGEGVQGFYDSEYPNGWADVWANHEQGFNNSSAMQYVEQWRITVSGEYTYPPLCVDVGIVDFGCFDMHIDGRVFGFIALVLIVTALITARQITLGA